MSAVRAFAPFRCSEAVREALASGRISVSTAPAGTSANAEPPLSDAQRAYVEAFTAWVVDQRSVRKDRAMGDALQAMFGER